MQEVNERILRIIDHYCEGNKSQFAKMIGEKPQTINSWCKRKTVGMGIIKKILSKLPEIRASWLLAEEGDMLNSDTDEQENINSETENTRGEKRGVIVRPLGSESMVKPSGFIGAASPLLPGISSSYLKLLSQYDEALLKIKDENEQLKSVIQELKSKLQ